MNELDTGKDKIKKICDILKNETLDPAKKEAEKIIQEAQNQARLILKEAETETKRLLSDAQKKIANEKLLLEKQISAALLQAKEKLRQEIEKRLLNEGLCDLIDKKSADPELAAKIISSLVRAVEKEGLSADFSAEIGKNVSVEKINSHLMDGVLNKLRERSVVVGDFIGGAQLKLHDRRMTLDMSDRALKELLGSVVRKEFRDLLFKDE